MTVETTNPNNYNYILEYLQEKGLKVSLLPLVHTTEVKKYYNNILKKLDKTTRAEIITVWGERYLTYDN